MCLLLPLIVSGDLVLGGQGQPGEGAGAPGAEGEHATSCQERHGGTHGDGGRLFLGLQDSSLSTVC